VENSKSQSEFPTLSTGLGNPAKSVPDFHIPTAPAAGFILKMGRKNAAATEFQLTDPGHFQHHKNASVASLRM
jgi:hypothetical protein